MEKLGVALCIIFPSKNPKHGNDVCEDFGIDVSHAEVYADVSNDQIVYQQMGLYKKTRETSGEASSISKVSLEHIPSFCCFGGTRVHACRTNLSKLGAAT